MVDYYLLNKMKYNKKSKKWEVPYFFYGGYPREWREDTAYLTNKQISNMKKSGKKHGYDVWRLSINNIIIPYL